MHEVNSRRLGHLIALAEEGSFARAAERVHLSQPALSRSIQALEEEVGMKLFDRAARGVAMTAAGRLLVERARRVLFETRCLFRDVELLKAHALHVVYSWFDDRERSLPTVIVQQGATAGVIIAGPALTYISQRWHWHATFLTLGAVGIGWTILWLCLGKTGNRQHNASPALAVAGAVPRAASLRLRHMLSDRTVIGVMLQCFVAYAVIAIGFTWVPAYFRLGLGFAATQAGWLFALQVAAQIPIGIALAMVSHRMLKRGVSSKAARGKLISAVCVVSGLAYCALLFGAPPLVKVALMGLASALALQTFTFGPMLVAEVAPVARRGALLAITNSIFTTAGLIGPVAMGKLLGAAGDARGYEIGFAVTGVLLLIVGTTGFTLIDPQRSKRRMEGAPA